MSLRKKDTFLIKGVLRIIQMNKGRLKLTELIHVCIKVIIIILIGVVMIGMLQLIFGIINESIRMGTRDSLALMVNDIATFFIFLEIILMLLRYIEDIYHAPVKYIIIIGITAIAREILLTHGNDFKMLILSLSILVLVWVLNLLKNIGNINHE